MTPRVRAFVGVDVNGAAAEAVEDDEERCGTIVDGGNG